MTFGQIIKKQRRDADMTQERLAELLSISPQAVSRWETDIAMPDISLLAPLANLFHVTTDQLLGVDINKSEQRINEIWHNANQKACENSNDRYLNAIKIIRDGLKLYPDSWKLKDALISYLYRHPGNDNEYLANLREMNKLCEEVIASCPDRVLQYHAISNLCFASNDTDNTERALQLAKTMPHHFECQEDLLIGIYGNEKGEQSIKESIRVSQIDLSNRLYQLATRKNASAALVLSLYQKYKAIEKILYDDDYIKSGLLGSNAIQWAECFANVGNNDMAFDILNQELSRMKEIAECKLTSFSYLVPAYISKQIEEKDMTERCSDLSFSANDYLSYLEKYFTNSIKNDHRYNQYVFELYAFIDKYKVN